VVALAGCGQAAQNQGIRASASASSVSGGLPTVDAGQLPAEARKTLELIDSGGPFPYKQDGAVFQNRERLLPARARGYYHEYTVPTPGSPDRGARRVIVGGPGERYYTDDHYRSFRRIVS
jgi:ribonuclease T1